MAVTIKGMFRTLLGRPVTLTYPHVKPELSKAYRSAIKLIRFDETESHDCVACMQCVNICPSYCITIEGTKHEGIKKKRATRFDMDFALCSLCGLCIDVCPTVTLEYSRLYDEAGYTSDWTFDLLEEFQDGEAAFLERTRAAEAIKKEEADRKKAEIARKKAEAAALQAAQEAESTPPATNPSPDETRPPEAPDAGASPSDSPPSPSAPEEDAPAAD